MKFEDEWNQIMQTGHYGSFTFNGSVADWRSAVASHFKTTTFAGPCYGVYLVRQKTTNNIIYVGKAGTVRQDGTFKDQDLKKRLVNREKGKSRKEIFGMRVTNHGELLIEYVVFKSNLLIPGYIEARLLQAYFDENKKLPVDNASL